MVVRTLSATALLIAISLPAAADPATYAQMFINCEQYARQQGRIEEADRLREAYEATGVQATPSDVFARSPIKAATCGQASAMAHIYTSEAAKSGDSVLIPGQVEEAIEKSFPSAPVR